MSDAVLLFMSGDTPPWLEARSVQTIGTVNVECKISDSDQMKDIMNLLRERAAKMGGNAVLEIVYHFPSQGGVYARGKVVKY